LNFKQKLIKNFKYTITSIGKTQSQRINLYKATFQSKMTSMTTSIIAKFSESIDINKEYTLSEILAVLSADYKAIKAITTPTKITKVVKIPGAPRKGKKLDFDNVDSESSENEKKPRKKNVKRQRDADGNIVKKRAPSAYNIFVAAKIAEIKKDIPNIDSKEAFKAAVLAWNEKKNESSIIISSDEEANNSN
jgi:hypothetical protein